MQTGLEKLPVATVGTLSPLRLRFDCWKLFCSNGNMVKDWRKSGIFAASKFLKKGMIYERLRSRKRTHSK